MNAYRAVRIVINTLGAVLIAITNRQWSTPWHIAISIIDILWIMAIAVRAAR